MSSRTIQTGTHAQAPTGAPFHIDRIPWHPGMELAQANVDLSDNVMYDWPMVYILSNAREAYVGQTTSAVRRMTQHGENPEKQAFSTLSLIYNSEFNASVITDYENRLISLMGADDVFTLTNKNGGMTQSNYFSKEKYEEMFADLWKDLQGMGLVHQSIHDIEESEFFKYSPFKCLNDDQQRALEDIVDAIDSAYDKETGTFTSTEPIVVTGEPGTGKTVLAVCLLKALRDNPDYQHLNVRMMEPVTGLRTTLQKALDTVMNISSKDIIGPGDLVKPRVGYREGRRDNIDILLVDEAHKLKQRKNLGTQFHNFDVTCQKLGLDPYTATQVDWALDQAKLPIFFYDPLQNIGPSGAGEDRFRMRMGRAFTHPIELRSQMRVAGGNAYLTYVQDLLNQKRDLKPQTFPNYEFVLHSDFGEFEASFEKSLATNDLTRMLAGYAWPWASKKDKSAYDIKLDGVEKRWNATYDNWIGMGVDDSQYAHEVGCIHSSQGYDLTYAYVIIGPDVAIDPVTGELRAVPSHYFDKTGKNTATEEELTQYLKNIYYVLMTRGIKGTHLYVCDPLLRKWFQRFVPEAS